MIYTPTNEMKCDTCIHKSICQYFDYYQVHQDEECLDYNVGLVEELENIKAKFLHKCEDVYRFDNEIILNGFEELIDKRISKLKGEE